MKKQKNRKITLKSRPVGMPLPSDFNIEEEAMPVMGAGDVLLKSIYISVDPYLRGKMNGTHPPAFELNGPVASKVIAQVVQSDNKAYQEGEYITAYMDWKDYNVAKGEVLQKIEPIGVPLSAYLGVLGITGLSAYIALMDIGKPKRGEVLVVSGAAGAVGTIAGQIGKIIGCRVVGIAGTDEKVALLKTKFGFDDAINYKTTPNIKDAVARLCPDGIDIYFDNVGGSISAAVITHMNKYGRIAACGSISNYNDVEEKNGTNLLPLIVYKFLTIQGFLIGDHVARFPAITAQLATWLKEEKLTYSETIIDGFIQLPEAFIGLFEGRNQGKMLVKV